MTVACSTPSSSKLWLCLASYLHSKLPAVHGCELVHTLLLVVVLATPAFMRPTGSGLLLYSAPSCCLL
jgi:hypothetical protein